MMTPNDIERLAREWVHGPESPHAILRREVDGLAGAMSEEVTKPILEPTATKSTSRYATLEEARAAYNTELSRYQAEYAQRRAATQAWVDKQEARLARTGAAPSSPTIQNTSANIATEPKPTFVQRLKDWRGKRAHERNLAEYAHSEGISIEQARELHPYIRPTTIENVAATAERSLAGAESEAQRSLFSQARLSNNKLAVALIGVPVVIGSVAAAISALGHIGRTNNRSWTESIGNREQPNTNLR